MPKCFCLFTCVYFHRLVINLHMCCHPFNWYEVVIHQASVFVCVKQTVKVNSHVLWPLFLSASRATLVTKTAAWRAPAWSFFLFPTRNYHIAARALPSAGDERLDPHPTPKSERHYWRLPSRGGVGQRSPECSASMYLTMQSFHSRNLSSFWWQDLRPDFWSCLDLTVIVRSLL